MEKVDLIIGTQLISKGHNFPNIKTVGILNIDYLLNDLISDLMKRPFNKSCKFLEEQVEKLEVMLLSKLINPASCYQIL